MNPSLIAQWGMIGFSLAAVLSAVYVNYRERDWIRATGRVVELVPFKENANIQIIDLDVTKEENTRVTLAPRIEFDSRQGPVSFTSRTGHAGHSPRIGSTVHVLYDPDNPADAHIDTPLVKYWPSLVSGFLAAVCGLFLAIK